MNFTGLLLSAMIAPATVGVDDVVMLEGEAYRGVLVYQDYQSVREISIPASLRVAAAGNARWSFHFEYPDEPQANSIEEIMIEEDGIVFAGARVVDRVSESGAVRVVTETDGEDAGRRATIRMVYTLSPFALTIRKEVRFQGESEFFMRNEYRLKR